MTANDNEKYIPLKDWARINFVAVRYARKLASVGKIKAKKIRPRGKWLIDESQKWEPEKWIHKLKPRDPHVEDLADLAKQLIHHWEQYYLRCGAGREPTGEYIVADDELWLIDYDLAKGLLTHLKYRYPEFLRESKDWTALIRRVVPTDPMNILKGVAYRRDVRGTCHLCDT